MEAESLHHCAAASSSSLLLLSSLQEDSPQFPTITGHTLTRHQITLPDDLSGNVALVSVSMRAYGMVREGVRV